MLLARTPEVNPRDGDSPSPLIGRPVQKTMRRGSWTKEDPAPEDGFYRKERRSRRFRAREAAGGAAADWSMPKTEIET